MSNVKVNGNTYNGIDSVRLPLADGTGYAEYKEGVSQEENTIFGNLLSGNNIGDYTNEDVEILNHKVFNGLNAGTLSFPNAVSICAGDIPIMATNFLVPNVVDIAGTTSATFRKGSIPGTLDLRSFKGIYHGYTPTYGNLPSMMQVFMNCTIGTLRLDSLNGYRDQMVTSATITNLVWGGADLVAADIKNTLNGATAITNLYITDAIYDDVAALIADGTVTKVANLYKYSEWSDG